MGVIEVAEVVSEDGRSEELRAILPQVVELLERLPTVRRCAALRQVEDPHHFLFVIEWDSLEAHSSFRESVDFVRYQQLVNGLIHDAGRFAHYNVIATSPPQAR